MNKPTIKGTVAYNKKLKLNRAGYENLPDGRSKSSAFQQNPDEMSVEDKIRMADQQFGRGAYAVGDYYDPPTFGSDYAYHGFADEFNADGSRRNYVVNEEMFDKGMLGTKHYHTGELHDRQFGNDIVRGRILDRIRRMHGSGSEQEKEYNRTFYGTENPRLQDTPDPNRISEYVRRYNNWLGSKAAMNEYEPGSGDDYTFQEYQQQIADAEQKRRSQENSPTTYMEPTVLKVRTNPMDMSDREMAVELVASGKFKTIQEAMDAVQADSPARRYKKGY